MRKILPPAITATLCAMGLGMFALGNLTACSDPCTGARELVEQAIRVTADREIQVKTYVRALKKCPSIQEELLSRANQLIGQQMADDAASLLRAILEVDPQSAGVHSAFGNIHTLKGNLSKAVESYKKAIEIQPGEPTYSLQLANAYQGMKDLPNAIAAYNEALKKGADPTRVNIQLGVLHKDAGEYEKAKTYLLQATKDSPNSAQPFFFLGQIEMEEQSPSRAKVFLSQATTLDPNLAAAQLLYGQAALVTDELDTAVRHLGFAARLRPNDTEAFTALAWALYLSGQSERGYQIASRAYQMNPNDASIRDTLGHILNEMEQPDQALTLFKDLINERPENPWTNYGIGRSYLALGNKEEGEKYLQKAVQLNDGKRKYLNQKLAELGYGSGPASTNDGSTPSAETPSSAE